MSITAKELIYNLKNLRAGGVQSDDTKLSDRQMLFIINYYRAKLIRQEHGKNRITSQEEVQNLGEVELIKTDSNEYDCGENACVLRTKKQVPRSLITHKSHGFTFVGMVDGMSWQYANTMDGAAWSQFQKYTGNKTKWVLQGRYIYIINPIDPLLTYISIRGVFEDPLEAASFREGDCDTKVGCDPLDFGLSYTNAHGRHFE